MINKQVSPTRKFDPAKGCQPMSTGALGGFFMLALACAYAFFHENTLPGGGPLVTDAQRLLAGLTGFEAISRDYFDIMCILLLGFQLMVTWEAVEQKIDRLLILSITAMGVWGVWRVALGAQWYFTNPVYSFWGWQWTRMEVVFALIFAGLFLVLLLPISRWRQAIGNREAAPMKRALMTSFYRWLSGLLLFAIVLAITFRHPFYSRGYYANWRITCGYLFLAYAFLGWPYAFLTNLLRKSIGEDRSDPCFLLLLIFTNILGALRRLDAGRLRRVLANERVLIGLRDLLVKFFFVPLMVVFLFVETGGLYGNFPKLLDSLGGDAGWPMIFNYFYESAFHGIFFMDVSLGLIGYVCSSRWLGNKSCSVDGTLSGWMAALACYPPFNDITGGYLPYSQMPGVPFSLLQSDWINATLKILTLLLFAVYVWATMAFGLRFSNLTNRGIIATGPYAWIRHPAYVSKNLAWWTGTIQTFSSAWQFLFLGLWNLIYYLRAATEEKHLLRDPNYRAYCGRVRRKFIPWVW